MFPFVVFPVNKIMLAKMLGEGWRRLDWVTPKPIPGVSMAGLV